MYARTTVTLLAAAVLTAGLCASAGTADVLTFFPTDDTYINVYDVTHGSADKLKVRNRYGAGGSNHWELDTLVKFDLSSIPPGTSIESATLYLYYYDHIDTNPAGRILDCHRILEDWEEDTVTGYNQPDFLGEPTSGSPVPQYHDRWMTWDVTGDVQDFVNDPDIDNYGWEIRDNHYWGTYDIPYIMFRSKEFEHGARSPYLEVVPEPASLVLLLFGGLAAIRQRRAW